MTRILDSTGRWERYSLSAFDRGRGVKWGEGRGEVLRRTIFWVLLLWTVRSMFIKSFIVQPGTVPGTIVVVTLPGCFAPHQTRTRSK